MKPRSSSTKIRILDKYIFRELASVFLAGICIVMAVLYLEKIHFISRLVITKGISLEDFARLLIYISPAFLMVAIPLSILLASLITFARLSADNEITAMRACGIGFHRFLLPVLAFSLIIYGADLYLAVKVQHAGNYKYIKLLRKILSEKISLALEERVFFDRIKDTVIFINEKPAGAEDLKGVFIYNGRNPDKPEYISAENGRFITFEDQVVLRLRNGAIYTGDRETMRLTQFGVYELVFDTQAKDHDKYVLQPREMSIDEIGREVEEKKRKKIPYFGDTVEIQKRFAFPFSAIIFALLGAPIGIRSREGGKWSGMGVGIFMIIVNYLLLMLSEGLGREGTIPPALAVWIPNIIMGVIAFYLIYLASHEISPSGFLERAGRILPPFRKSGKP